ncbi:MAG: M28 family peptidase, partial [Chthoniobacteraceae bacterium]
DVTLPRNTPAKLASGIFAAADALGVRRNFGYSNGDITDDHTPLQVIARIPSMDIIDFDYPPWHTSGDTLDKLSAASLQTIGHTTLWLLVRELAK